MAGLESDTIGGFNAFIKKQSQLEAKRCIAALFDDQYEIVWNGVGAKRVRLTDKEYFVRGYTALLDAVGKTIVDVGYRLSHTNEEDRPSKVIFVITTDGQENASSEFTYEKVKKLIKQQQEKFGWEFIFLGANIDALNEANRIGIRLDNAYNFEASKTGVEKMYSLASEAVMEKRGSENE